MGKIFGGNRHLRTLMEQARHHTELLLQVRALLPAPLRDHCHAAHIQGDQAVLFTDSPAWVMRLRFSAPQIVRGLQSTRPTVRGVRVRVQLAERRNERRKRSVSLSNETRRHLHEAAAGLDNAALAAALERLSRAG